MGTTRSSSRLGDTYNSHLDYGLSHRRGSTTSYNRAGQPLSLRGAITFVSGADYTALGAPSLITYGNGLKTTYLYFGVNFQSPGYPTNMFYGRLRQICVTSDNCALGYYTGTLMNHAYWYDSVGNITTVRDDVKGQRTNFATTRWTG